MNNHQLRNGCIRRYGIISGCRALTFTGLLRLLAKCDRLYYTISYIIRTTTLVVISKIFGEMIPDLTCAYSFKKGFFPPGELM